MSKGQFGEPWKLIWHGNERYPFPLSIHTADDACWIARDGTVSSAGAAWRVVACVNACTGITDPVDAVERARVALRTIDAMPHYTAPIPENYVASLLARYEKCLLAAAEALAALGESHE